MQNIVEHTVGELVVNFDRLRKPLSAREREKRRGKYPYYGATCIFDYVDDYIFDGEYILLGEDGTVLESNGTPVLQRISGKTWVNNHAHVLRNTDLVDFDYLYYALKNTNFESAITGAVQLKISQANMNAVKLCIHEDKTEQKKVAKVLSAFDKKIELNERISLNLFQEAQALFKSRFIDLDDAHGELPSNWKEGCVGDIIELHDSKRVPLSGKERASRAKVYPYYGAASCMDYVDDYLFDGIYLLLGEDGTVIDDSGHPILQYVSGKFWVNNHAHIITGKLGFSVEELYLLFSLTNIENIVTGAVQQKISQANLRKVKVIIPAVEELQKFDELIQPIFTRIREVKIENESLSKLRDTLLPALMSGKMILDDIQVGK